MCFVLKFASGTLAKSIMGRKKHEASGRSRKQPSSGQEDRHGVLWPGRNMIDISYHPPGIYLLQLTGDDGRRKVIRVIKE